jgi:hypothetical protein
MQLAKKIQIYPTEEQIDVLWQLSEKCRVAGCLKTKLDSTIVIKSSTIR